MRISTDELSKKAYKKVREMIISGELAPGQKIVQDSLAEKLGISRTPLRTALQFLQSENLVESVPRRGMIVKAFSRQEMLEVYDCRIALESMAVKRFSQRATKKDIEKLKSIFSPFRGKQSIGPDEYIEADAQFHDLIIKKSGNTYLYNLFHRGNLLVWIQMIGLVRFHEETLPEHEQIIEALEKRDTETAVRLAIEHLEKSKTLILNQL